MQGRCIQAPEKSNLIEGEIYYLFPHGNLFFEASRFPHSGSHFGTYQKSCFEIITEDFTDTPIEEIKTDIHPKKYLARILKPPSYFYRVGEEYIITEQDENGYYSIFLKSRPNYAPVGAYKTNFFEIIEPFLETHAESVPKQKVEPVLIELPQDQWQQMNLFSI